MNRVRVQKQFGWRVNIARLFDLGAGNNRLLLAKAVLNTTVRLTKLVVIVFFLTVNDTNDDADTTIS